MNDDGDYREAIRFEMTIISYYIAYHYHNYERHANMEEDKNYIIMHSHKLLHIKNITHIFTINNILSSMLNAHHWILVHLYQGPLAVA
jgi:hypothetical protein